MFFLCPMRPWSGETYWRRVLRSYSQAVDIAISHMEASSPTDTGQSTDDGAPEALRELYARGTRFTKSPEKTWRVTGRMAILRKNVSLFFTSDVVCTLQDITVGLRDAGVNLGAIASIQRRASNQS